MLASDLDGTLLGDDAALGEFAEWVKRQGGSLSLVYVTGRFFDSIVQAIETSRLPAPRAVIGGVGTELYEYPSGVPLREWRARVRADWDPQKVRRALRDEAALELQEEQYQSQLKASYHVHDASAGQLERWRAMVRSAGVRAEMIYSSARDLDFLPAGMNKGAAAAFLAARWGIPAEAVLVSGDTGNDRALFEQGFGGGIVVANARPELRSLTGPNVYHARRPYAAGVLEGIRYFWRTDEPDRPGI